MVSKVRQNLTYIFTSALIAVVFLTTHTNESHAQGFFEDVELNLRGGLHNFHGNFVPGDGYTDIRFVPHPFEGYHFSVAAVKPIDFGVPELRLKIHAGLEYLHYQSRGAHGPPFPLRQVDLIPMNIRNHGFGPYVNLGFEYLMTERFSVEFFVGAGAYFHDPKTDGFLTSSGRILSSNELQQNVGFGVGAPPYSLRDFPTSRFPGEEISSVVPSANLGLRFSRQFLGNYKWFFEYSHKIMLDSYFDGVRDADLNAAQADIPDGISGISAGVVFPLDRRARATEEQTQRRERLDRRELIRVERVENIAALIDTEDDLRELQRVMSDKILLYDTPGVRFNELAAKVTERRIRLADSDIMTEMVELPGASYIIGLNAVDPLNIQVQSKKRITINPFMIDKYAISNRQYRAFLIAMGAIPRPATQAGGDPATFNFGSALEWDELLRRADLTNFRDNVDPIRLDDVEDLLPDSTKWVEYGLNDVVAWDIYFYDPFYDNYPVVNINWYQAKLFAAWAGKRLPTESEWEYAARSGVSGRIYPWDGLEVQSKTGEYRANFMQERGVYDKDGYAIMAPVDAYLPNDFGLYNMAGNVSEWVLDSYNPSYSVLQNVGTANFVSPSYVNPNEPRKVHRGGSWQSTEFFLGVGVRNFQHKNVGTPMVGFRAARSITRRYGQ